MERRTSVRSFAREPIDGRIIDQVIRSARVQHQSMWGTEGRRGGIGVHVAAYQVEGSAPGLYRLSDDGWSTRRSVQSVPPELLADLAARYADSPALLFICGERDGRGPGPSVSQYSELLVRCGSLGYSLWLEAVRLGLSGSVHGVTSPEVGDALRTEDKHVSHLFTLAIGLPTASTGTS
ncbi:hypothetical protein [Kitasatospora sp. LaBMicrA B282]|uniref:hypothetical protein n=1 Tax=Kitasatospora sp. LaBMicrA B282 TaxID=3420949 RepID=UPI003D11BEF9